MSNVIEHIIGVDIPMTDTLRKAIAATGGKPSLVFPFLIKDYQLFSYYDKDLYRYNGKYYDRFDDFEIDRLVRRFYLDNNLQNNYSLNRARELKGMIKFDPQIVRTTFDHYEDLVNLNNGIYNYETRELIPHSHEYKFTYCLDVDYDPQNTDCPIFTRFLEGCFANSGSWKDGYEYDKDVYENIVRLCGYLLYPINTIEGLFIFIGGGSNGKSVLMDTLKLFFPPKYVTNLSLNAISNEEGFTREKLLKSRINFCTEQRGGRINSEELKKVASGEGITIQRKFNEAIDIDSHAKILVSSNNMPFFKDTTHGILRRLFLFNFRNRFVDDKKFAIEASVKERRIFQGLDKKWLGAEIKKEKAAIFNLFLGGLERLRADKWQFIASQNMKDILAEYEAGSDILSTWIKEHYELGDGEFDFVSVSDLYIKFRDWYENNFGKRCSFSSISVGKKIRDIFRLHESITFVSREEGRSVKITGYPLKEKADVGELEKLMGMNLGDVSSSQPELDYGGE